LRAALGLVLLGAGAACSADDDGAATLPSSAVVTSASPAPEPSTTLFSIPPSQEGGIVDCYDVMWIGGSIYNAAWRDIGVLTSSDLGAVIGRVPAESTCSAHMPTDVDFFASLLPAGTEVWSITGIDVRSWVAVVQGEGVVPYRVAADAVGAPPGDRMGFGDSIVAIDVYGPGNETPVATIDEPALVSRLANAVEASMGGPGGTDDAVSGELVQMQFVRADGLSVPVVYVPDLHHVVGGADLPDWWRTTIEDALAAAPPYTGPVPTTAPAVDATTVSTAATG
jgi:hypothetical protein